MNCARLRISRDFFHFSAPALRINARSPAGVNGREHAEVGYNHKRHGEFKLGGRKFAFRSKPHFPKSLTKEFLLVDLVNNLDHLAESKSEVLDRVKERAASFDGRRLRRAVRDYGSVRTRKFFDGVLAHRL